MRKTVLFILLITVVFFQRCKNQSEPRKERIIKYEENSDALASFDGVSLQPYDIDAILFIPNEATGIGTSTNVQVKHILDHFKWEVIAGPKYKIEIQDWGGTSVFETKINELKNQELFTVEFLDTSTNYAFYRKTLNNSKGKEHQSYHVIAQHTINTINYIFKTPMDGVSKRVASYMTKTIKHVDPITEKVTSK